MNVSVRLQRTFAPVAFLTTLSDRGISIHRRNVLRALSESTPTIGVFWGDVRKHMTASSVEALTLS